MAPGKQNHFNRQLSLDLHAPARLLIWRLAINAGLLLGMAALLLAYIIISNQVVARRYSLRQLRGQLNEANAAWEGVNAASESKYSLDDLNQFAKQQGLVESREGGAIFAQSGVALSPNQ